MGDTLKAEPGKSFAVVQELTARSWTRNRPLAAAQERRQGAAIASHGNHHFTPHSYRRRRRAPVAPPPVSGDTGAGSAETEQGRIPLWPNKSEDLGALVRPILLR